jgi:hypothetical protein
MRQSQTRRPRFSPPRWSDLGRHVCVSAAILLLAISTAAQTGSYRVAGTVVNAATGEPVSGAMVALLTIEDSATFAATESGADGRFDIENLPAAKFQLTASRRGYSTSFYNQHGNFNSAIVTGVGPDSGLDTGHIVFQLAPEAVLSGVVSGDGGDPVEGATVMLFEKPRGHGPGAKIEPAGTATTDDTGAYEFSGLTAGDYLLAVRARPWYAISSFSTDLLRHPETEQQTALDVAYPVTFFDSTTDEASAAPIALTDGSRLQANINLHAVPALHFEVQMPQKADGTVVQPDLTQTIFGSDAAGEEGFMSRSRDGVTEFAGVAPGTYELTQGDPPRILLLNAAASQQVSPDAGAPAVAISGSLEPVQGTVLNGSYEITLEPAGPADGAGDGSPIPQPVFAIPRSFSFRAVPAGSWRLHVSNGLDVVSIAADGHTHPGNLLAVQDHALSIMVTVSAGRRVRIEGFARKKERGFAGAMIVLVPKDLKAMAELARRDQSDSDGSFALLNVEPGDYTVVAIEDGWELDWGDPAVIARYLPGGQPVTVKDSSDSQSARPASPDRRITLAGPVAVQSK